MQEITQKNQVVKWEFKAALSEIDKGAKFLKKLWCFVGGRV